MGMQTKCSQDWAAYNQAKTREKLMFMRLLRDLVSYVPDKERYGAGRPSVNLREMIFNMCLAIYTSKSSRRANSELELAQKLNFVSHKPHFNTVLKYFNNKELTNILHNIVTLSALPLKTVESDFTVDSSGFSTSMYACWNNFKWGKKDGRERVWRKASVMSGVKTNIITSIEVTSSRVADITLFIPLVERTGRHFSMDEVSADKAYCARKAFNVVNKFGAVPYIPFKKNVTGRSGSPGSEGSYTWMRMFKFFKENEEEFMKHYHKRSNAETVFAMMKRKFNTHLRSKNKTAQDNELICMAICHNICVLIQEIFELGIEVDFGLYSGEMFEE